jgi:leucyl-tRNA synthetase
MVSAAREATEILIRLIAPMTPHLAEECWTLLGCSGIVAESGWPAYDEALVADNEVTLPVQINGKKRADLTIARDADQSQVERAVLELESVRAALDGKVPKKIIVVPQRIVNVVV